MADEKKPKQLAPWFANVDDIDYAARKRGRPGRLTHTLIHRITTLMEAGVVMGDAIVACGISQTIYYRWLKIGNAARSGIYRDFVEAIHRSAAIARTRSAIAISSAAQKDWRAAAFYLERRASKDWGKRDHVEIGGSAKVVVEERRTALVAVAQDPELQRALVRMAEMLRPARVDPDVVDVEVLTDGSDKAESAS